MRLLWAALVLLIFATGCTPSVNPTSSPEATESITLPNPSPPELPGPSEEATAPAPVEQTLAPFNPFTGPSEPITGVEAPGWYIQTDVAGKQYIWIAVTPEGFDEAVRQLGLEPSSDRHPVSLYYEEVGTLLSEEQRALVAQATDGTFDENDSFFLSTLDYIDQMSQETVTSSIRV